MFHSLDVDVLGVAVFALINHAVDIPQVFEGLVLPLH